MRVLSLFSGGGLGDLGLELAGMKIVGQVEIDEYCQKILQLRWPEVPKWTDIKKVHAPEHCKAPVPGWCENCLLKSGSVDLIAGGFPCQPFSYAGKRKGAEDDRNLWPEMFRVISEVRPTWVLAENVSGVFGFMESVVLPDLETAGYETLPPLVFEAHALGAPHPRERVWIIAHNDSQRSNATQLPVRPRRPEKAETIFNWSLPRHRNKNCGSATANLVEFGSIGRLPKSGKEATRWAYAQTTGRYPWCCEPGIRRVVHGRAKKMDRLKLLGSGQVVQVVEWIGKRIMEFSK